MLNLVLAVIVDNFGELRDARKDAQNAKSTICFICSIERERFKKEGIGKWWLLVFFLQIKKKIFFFSQISQVTLKEITAPGIIFISLHI